MLGRVYGIYTKDKVRRPELHVLVNNNLRLEYEIQVPYMNRSNVWGKH